MRMRTRAFRARVTRVCKRANPRGIGTTMKIDRAQTVHRVCEPAVERAWAAHGLIGIRTPCARSAHGLFREKWANHADSHTCAPYRGLRGKREGPPP
jgi:hypothetical protein